MTVSVQFLWFVVILVGFTVGFVSYWVGMDKGSKESFEWRTRFEEERARRVLAEQRERDASYPRSAWNNFKVAGESLD
jgi:hypothetical protein